MKVGLNILLRGFLDLLFLPVALIFALLARVIPKIKDVGLGPEPMINNVYHKLAFQHYGYTAETFVHSVYWITDEFDVRFDQVLRIPRGKYLVFYVMYIFCLIRYRVLYLYFNGGPLGFTIWLWRIEPFFYRIAGIKTVLLAYGGDIQDLTLCPNLLFKGTVISDYPEFHKQRKKIATKISLWTEWGNHIIGGCDWVDYMYHWDTLMISHFAIDLELWKTDQQKVFPDTDRPIRVLHAPNHRMIKGSQYFIDAIDQLRAEGENIELVLLEKIPNSEMREVMLSVDLVADQLIIGWYAMFAIEAMAMCKPVICYLREDLHRFYVGMNIIGKDEIPVISADPFNVKETLRSLIRDRGRLVEIGKSSREYVEKHHSFQAIGAVFDSINREIGIIPKNL